ncbi:hypothetical protein, partial [Pseudomonas viridiflava]|uniref:hypothetical protein n=1 Tax=Pseudomonas viridiflava TaxID=33069 RepID=UPI0019CFAD5D
MITVANGAAPAAAAPAPLASTKVTSPLRHSLKTLQQNTPLMVDESRYQCLTRLFLAMICMMMHATAEAASPFSAFTVTLNYQHTHHRNCLLYRHDLGKIEPSALWTRTK